MLLPTVTAQYASWSHEAEGLRMACDSIDGVCFELNAIQRNQFQAIFGTNIDAAAAEHAIRAILLAALKNCVDVAPQAALRFGHRFLFGVNKLNLSHARPAIERQHGDCLPLKVHVVHRHLPAVQNLHLNLRLWMLVPAQVLVNANCRAFPIADAIDNQSRTECTITAGKHARRGGHQSFAMHVDQTLRRDLHAIIRAQELEIRRLTDGENYGVALKLGFAVLM